MRILVGDLKVIVYGFSVISAVKPPVVKVSDDSSFFKETSDMALALGKRGMFGKGSL